MKVKLICCKCGEKHYTSEWSLKKARETKRNYKQGKFTCNKCGGFNCDYSMGILSWNNQSYEKF